MASNDQSRLLLQTHYPTTTTFFQVSQYSYYFFRIYQIDSPPGKQENLHAPTIQRSGWRRRRRRQPDSLPSSIYSFTLYI